MRLERELLGRAFLLSVVAGVLSVLVAAVLGDGRTAASAAVGAVLVVAFLAVGQVPLAAAARGHAGLGAMLLLLGYLSRMLLGLVALLLLLNGDGLDRRAVGLTVMATGAAWTAGALWSMVRWRPTMIDPGALAESEAAAARAVEDRRAGRPPAAR